MKEIMGVIAVGLGGLSAVFGVLGGVVLLKTWHYVFGILFAVKILISMSVLTATLSWWSVFLIPLGMLGGGFLFIGIGMLMGVIVQAILEG